MGVNGLWELLEACGERVPLEAFAGKRVAIDISIWIM